MARAFGLPGGNASAAGRCFTRRCSRAAGRQASSTCAAGAMIDGVRPIEDASRGRIVDRQDRWARAARRTSAGNRLLRDQWTAGGSSRVRSAIPSIRIFDDRRDSTVVYVSGATKAWPCSVDAVGVAAFGSGNWLGSVPHWLYPTALRQYPPAWNQVVIWTLSIGTFLTVDGPVSRHQGTATASEVAKLSSPHRRPHVLALTYRGSYLRRAGAVMGA